MNEEALLICQENPRMLYKREDLGNLTRSAVAKKIVKATGRYQKASAREDALEDAKNSIKEFVEGIKLCKANVQKFKNSEDFEAVKTNKVIIIKRLTHVQFNHVMSLGMTPTFLNMTANLDCHHNPVLTIH